MKIQIIPDPATDAECLCVCHLYERKCQSIPKCSKECIFDTNSLKQMRKNKIRAILYPAKGLYERIIPANKTDFTLKELQEYCGGTIDILPLPNSEDVMVLNDNSKLEGLPKNPAGTYIWKQAYPISQYPLYNDELIVGDIIICHKSMIK